MMIFTLEMMTDVSSPTLQIGEVTFQPNFEPLIHVPPVPCEIDNICYRCADTCMHHCQMCKVACHGNVRGCSKIGSDEGKFICFYCSDDTIIESEIPLSAPMEDPNVPTSNASKPVFYCPHCGRSFTNKYNLKRVKHILK